MLVVGIKQIYDDWLSILPVGEVAAVGEGISVFAFASSGSPSGCLGGGPSTSNIKL